jgi:hypothetical protein
MNVEEMKNCDQILATRRKKKYCAVGKSLFPGKRNPELKTAR